MNVRELYDNLRERYGARSDPATWWPIHYSRTDPPEFERVITNVLVTQSDWRRVRSAVDALEQAGLLTAGGLARAEEEVIAACAKPVGFQAGKARCLKALGAFVVARFGTESAFCAGVTREQLLTIQGVGDETADRILLYTCNKLAWPVDTYCFRVFAHHEVIAGVPDKQAAKRRLALDIKRMVAEQMVQEVEDWQRLHALMQIEGEAVRKRLAAAK